MAQQKIKLNQRRSPLLIIVGLVVAVGLVSLIASYADTTDYSAPTITSAKAADDAKYSVTLNWTAGKKQAGAKDTAAGFIIVAKASTDKSFYIFAPTYPKGYSTTSATVSGLTCGKSYSFEIRAERKDSNSSTGYAGESPYSVTKSATPPCPSVTLSSFVGTGTSSLSAKWSGSSFITSYSLTLSGGASENVNAGKATSFTFSGVGCGKTYSLVVSGVAGSVTAKSATKTAATEACPVTTPPPKKTPTPVKKPVTTTHKSSSSSNVAAIPQPPDAPTAFTAVLQSDKVVDLSWDASTATAGIQDYIINRSTDNVNWEPLTTVTGTSYEDDSTDFATTYYYQIEAVDNSGNVSDYATTQITTNTFSGSSTTVMSDDKLVTITVPSDAFSQQADCTIGSSSGTSGQSDGKSIMLLGPYDLLCVGEDGSVLDSFSEPLKATINLSEAAGFKDFTVRSIDGSNTKLLKSTYNPGTKKISFQLTGNLSFAPYGVRTKSSSGAVVIIILILFLLLLLAAGFIFLRRRMVAGGNPAIPSSAMASLPSAAEQFQDAVNKPNCTHLDMAHQVLPQSEGCQECIAAGRQWKSLRICLTCGHVGCSDDSEGQDARHHFEQTGHPLIMAYNEPAAGNIGWCYIDQTYI